MAIDIECFCDLHIVLFMTYLSIRTYYFYLELTIGESQTCWHTHVIPALRRLKQEDDKFRTAWTA
jgi:hypothetical protein